MRWRQCGSAMRHLLALAVTAVVLVVAQPDPTALRHGLAAPHEWVQRAGADAAAAQLGTAVVWVAAAWLAVGLLAGLAGLVPGTVGRCGRAVTGGLLPRVVRAGLAGSAGVCLVLSPAWADAGHATGTPTVAMPPVAMPPVATPPVATPPVATPPVATATAGPASGGPSAHWPLSASAPKPLPWPGHRSSPPRTTTPAAPPASPPPKDVTVRPGDSLWSLAAGRLGPHPTAAQITDAWPRWYRANRSVVGADPGLIRPGQHLTVPSDTVPSDTVPSDKGSPR